MRNGIIDEVYAIMKENKNSYFLTGDLGYNTLEKIEKDFGERFINIGIAEQNMIGIASGLAMTGKKVFVYSIIPFLIMRCYEQVRNDICYHDLDVTLLGSWSGLTYGILGSTHFALEDLAILRPLPNMTIFSPVDETEARLGMKSSANFHHPLYVRIGLRQEVEIYKKPYDFKFGKGVIVQNGEDLVFFVTGTLMAEVINAAKIIRKLKGLTSTIVNIHTIKPIDKDLILKEVKGKKLAVSVEEHGKIGGLGSAISEVLVSSGSPIGLTIVGTEDKFTEKIGTRGYLRKLLGLDSQGIVDRVTKELSR